MLNKFKHYIRDLLRYPIYQRPDQAYETYWKSRDIATIKLNSFQQKRAELLAKLIKDGDSVLDVGCGDGGILAYVREHAKPGRLLGIDSSTTVLEAARRRGLEVIQDDIRNPGQLGAVGHFDYVTLFEVLEHMVNAEELLDWSLHNARKEVVFSVPNTGFIFHRLRLLFGRFPLQWKAHPSEHVRFWTLRDMRWWLTQLDRGNARVRAYEGIPLLNRFWPALFARGIFVRISVSVA